MSVADTILEGQVVCHTFYVYPLPNSDLVLCVIAMVFLFFFFISARLVLLSFICCFRSNLEVDDGYIGCERILLGNRYGQTIFSYDTKWK